MGSNKNSREPKEVPKLAFPWAAEDGYFNGDMFEDWLNSELDPDNPYLTLAVVDVCSTLKKTTRTFCMLTAAAKLSR